MIPAMALRLLLASIPLRAMEPIPQPLCRDCNVLLISIDTLRADALGFMGDTRDTSPNMDRIARDGIAFTNAFSQAPNTLPSHMSIFTGLYPWHHRVRTIFKDSLDTKTPTLPQIFQSHGYRTIMIGPGDDPHLGKFPGFWRGFDEVLKLHQRSSWDQALRWLADNRYGHFFMFLHTYRVHDPYLPADASVLRFTASIRKDKGVAKKELRSLALKTPIPDLIKTLPPQTLEAHPELARIGKPEELLRRLALLGISPYPFLHNAFFERFDLSRPDDVSYLRLLYEAGVYEADQMVGGVMRQLQRSGLSKKTIVIITSDHGEQFMEHGGVVHDQLYQECLHVPLIFALPRGLKAGRRLPVMAQSVDILPTLLELTGLSAPSAIDGTSLASWIRSQETPPPCRYVFAEWNGRYSARDCDFSYLSYRAGPAHGNDELYDRRLDPGEKTDIAGMNPAVASIFARTLSSNTQDGLASASEWPAWMDAPTRARIQKSGYW